MYFISKSAPPRRSIHPTATAAICCYCKKGHKQPQHGTANKVIVFVDVVAELSIHQLAALSSEQHILRSSSEEMTSCHLTRNVLARPRREEHLGMICRLLMQYRLRIARTTDDPKGVCAPLSHHVPRGSGLLGCSLADSP